MINKYEEFTFAHCYFEGAKTFLERCKNVSDIKVDTPDQEYPSILSFVFEGRENEMFDSLKLTRDKQTGCLISITTKEHEGIQNIYRGRDSKGVQEFVRLLIECRNVSSAAINVSGDVEISFIDGNKETLKERERIITDSGFLMSILTRVLR